MSEDQLLDLLRQFVAAPSWTHSRRLVEDNPPLLSSAVDPVLERLADEAVADDDPRSARILNVHRALLRDCREHGIDVTFDTVIHAGVPVGLREHWRSAVAASDRYQETGDDADLEPADRALTALVDHPEFGAAPNDGQALMAYALGTALIDRYQREGGPADLDRAIDAFRLAADASPADDPEGPDYLAAVGNAYAIRHDERGDDADLRVATAAFDEAVRRLDDDDERLPKFLGEIAAILGAAYEFSGDSDVIATAIATAERAVQAGEGRPDLPMLLNNLVNCLISRYERGGDLRDLWAAAGHARRAVDVGADGEHRPVLLSGLGGVRLLQYDRDHRLDTLDNAIDALDRAVSGFPPRSPDRPVCLGSLGNAYLGRFELTGLETDLDRAHAVFREALGDVDPATPRSALIRGGLGGTLMHRHGMHHMDADLREAVALLESAVQAAQDAPRIRPYLLLRLASAYRRRHQTNGDPAGLAAGTDTYRQAYREGRATQLELSLDAGAEWGRWAAERAAWTEAGDAFDAAMDAAAQLFRTQFDRADKEVWLGAAAGLAERTAYAQVRAGRPASAVAAMERGRAQLLAEALRVELADRLPDLAERFRQRSERLRRLRWQPPLWSWSADLDEV